MGARRASATAVAVVAGLVLLVSVLATWAASIGPDRVLTGDGPTPHRLTPTSTPTASESGSGLPRLQDVAPPPRPGEHPFADALVSVAMVLLALGLVIGLVLLAKRAWERWQLRHRPPPPEDEVDFDPIRASSRVGEAIARDAESQRELLERGSPRNAIVACWRRFEEQAAEAGVRRRPWETSAEFTLRVLDLVDADGAAVARLAALFREARFSDHPLGEAQRAEALAALDSIHSSRAVGAATGPRPGPAEGRP